MTTIYRASTVHTLSPGVDGDAVAVVDGRVTAVGGWRRIRGEYPTAQVVDLGDATMVPGLIDSHIHPLGGIEMTRGVDLSACETPDDIARELARHWSDTPDDGWLLGWGLDVNAFHRAPSAEILDRVAPGVLAAITLADVHSVVASTAALRLAGVTGSEQFGDASAVVVDAAGNPTGHLLEGARTRVLGLVPPMSHASRVTSLRETLVSMAATGFTAGHALDMGAEDAELLLEDVSALGGLPLELTISPMIGPAASLDDAITHVIDLQSRRGERWAVSGVKLMIDGTVDGGTAWLYTPDTLGESTQSLWLDPRQYAHAVGRLHKAGVRTRTHAIGDKGVHFVAETLAALPSNGIRHRIEHLETITDQVIDLLASSGTAVSMQPTHCTRFVRADQTDNWSVRLGPERAARGWRTRDVRDRGLTLALGSDWPVAPADAREILTAAQTRRHPGGSGAPVGPEQALTALEALEGLTTHAAASIGAPARAIRPGAAATFTVFDRDPLNTAPEEFTEAAIVLTTIEGKPVVGAADLVRS
ncbi:amidohydrolase [Arthrobacter sp. ZGTC412]|uniref:amidohydrolase n=1 Tax=Arthrobacter sp. ZGTC412 TaxID=2058900 RepID=UPI0021589C45|nr:amidohydrolase [Arthrobacter sp. ZGTC412]